MAGTFIVNIYIYQEGLSREGMIMFFSPLHSLFELKFIIPCYTIFRELGPPTRHNLIAHTHKGLCLGTARLGTSAKPSELINHLQ